jgi:hypothetical protein
LVDHRANTLTLHTAFNGASLSLSWIEGVKLSGLVDAKGSRGETHVVRLDDIFAGTIEAPSEGPSIGGGAGNRTRLHSRVPLPRQSTSPST